MKKIVISLSLVLMSIGVFAQYQAGNILITGSLVIGGNQKESSSGGITVKEPKNTTFEIAPGLEFFLTDRIALGAEIGFLNQKATNENPPNNVDQVIDKDWMTTITPSASYYLINEEKMGLFLKFGVGFGFGKRIHEREDDGVTTTTEAKLSAFEIGIKPGIAVHLTERFGMTATFGFAGYSHDIQKWDQVNGTIKDKESNYGFQLSPELGFGLYFKLK